MNNNQQPTENKLVILYLIDRLNFEISNSQISKTVLHINEINYFFLQQYISELVESGYISCRVENAKRLYSITEAGKKTLEYFKTMIRASIRTKIDKIVEETTPSLRSETKIFADYIPINENEYTAKCSIKEGSTCLLEINLYAGTKEQARKICKNWENNSQEIYPKILPLLIEE